MAVLLITGLLLVALTPTVSAAGEDAPYENCYMVDSRSECLFTTLNWTSWNWAQHKCSELDGKLVTIDNPEMQNAVSLFADSLHFGVEGIWIGARRRSDDWTWVTDIPMKEMQVLNQSDSADFRVKVAVSKNNELIARHPRDELPYVCQYEDGSAGCKTRNKSLHFSEGASCFVFYSDHVTGWFNARNICLANGGDLATFMSAGVSKNVILKLASSPHWLGLQSIFWTWPSGSEARYTNWHHNEPSDPEKTCVSISKENPALWKTEHCTAKNLRFICQKNEQIIPCPIWTVLLLIAALVTLYLFTQRSQLLRKIKLRRRC